MLLVLLLVLLCTRARSKRLFLHTSVRFKLVRSSEMTCVVDRAIAFNKSTYQSISPLPVSAIQVARWNNNCLACREHPPEVFLKACGHAILCCRCFLDRDIGTFYGSPCPVCTQLSVGVSFSNTMLAYLSVRSQPRE